MVDDQAVITGAGIVCSLGSTASEVWEALISGKTGIQPIAGFDAGGFACRSAAQAPKLDPHALGLHPRDLRIMDPFLYLLMKCSRDAYVQVGLEKSSIPREEIGFFAGIGMIDYEVEQLLPAVLKSLNADGSLDYPGFYASGYQEIYPLWLLLMLNNIGFCQVATHLNVQGENTVFSPHADSGAMAVIEGIKAVLDRRARAVLCAGLSERVTPFSLARASFHGILNTAHGQNGGICRPFDAEREGTVLGEGCGVIVLEERCSSEERGVPCLGSITGYGVAFEAERASSSPSGKALSMAMRRALEQAELCPGDIDVVMAHGEGTVGGDRNEIEAIHDVFSSCIDRIRVFSSKGAIGHLLAGAPLVDIILGIGILKNGLLPGTLHVSSPDPILRFDLVRNGSRRVDPRRILINCQSYEGQAVSIVLEDLPRCEGS